MGAPTDDDGFLNSGSAYVFRFDGANWVQEAKLTASDAAENARFGRSVSLSGDVALIGGPGDEDNGVRSGSAYVFRFDGSNWVEEAELTASDAAAEDRFGLAVSISGDRALIGAGHRLGGSARDLHCQCA